MKPTKMITIKRANKKNLLIAIIIAVLIILAIFITTKLQNRKFSCSQDSDCVLVKEDCCGCESGGSSIAINKKYQQDWLSKIEKKENCNNIFCASVYKCPSQPRCIKNKCQIPIINQSAETTGIRLGITSASTEMTNSQEKTLQFGIKNIYNKNTSFNTNIYPEIYSESSNIDFQYLRNIELKAGDYKIQEIKIKTTNSQSGRYNFILAVCENAEDSIMKEECSKNSENIYAFSELKINIK